MSIRSVIGASVVSSFATTALLTMHPAAYAASAFASIASAVSCATTGACISGTNTSSGPGVSGTSAKGYGVEGTSTSNDGLKGISTSSNGLSATSSSSYGVKGESSTSYGVYASSASGGGVYGVTSATKTKHAGVMGVDNSTNGSMNDGVFGTVTNGGWGVEGESGDGASGGGVVGGATTATGVEGFSQGYGGTGVAGYAYDDKDGSGVYGSGYDAVVAQSFNELFAGENSSGSTVFSVDSAGNITYAGSLQPFARVKGGATIKAFAPKTTRPTIEDTGISRLTGGTATIALDAAFAASIETSSPYVVLITPEGETRGLFIASKDSHGFTVREAGGGRSSVSFDYRVVAVAQGHAADHMGAIDPATLPHVNVPKPPRPLLGRSPL